MDVKSGKNGPAVKKRPEIALYKPGMGKILGKKGDNEAVGKQSSTQIQRTKKKVKFCAESTKNLELNVSIT